MGKTKYYRYAKLKMEDRRYFCLNQNIFILMWILFSEKGTLQTIDNTLLHRFPYNLKMFRKDYRLLKSKLRSKIKLIIMFIGYKYYSKNNGPTISLPIYGQICMPVHKGYKVFDIRRRVVIKIFDNEIAKSAVISEIEKLTKVSMLNCAPSLRRWSIDEKWYEEDYIEGTLDSSYKPMDTNTLLEKFYRVIGPCIEELIVHNESQKLKMMSYVHDIRKKLENKIPSVQKIDIGIADKIAKFYHSILDKLNAKEDYPLFLVFSHGDFCPANMLNANGGIKIIDWEASSYRSALFDFYSYFFYRPVCRNIDIDQVSKEMNEAYLFLISRLSLSVPDIYGSIIASPDTYRWLFYMESLFIDIERLNTDKHLNIIGFILKYIESFRHYEEFNIQERKQKQGKFNLNHA